MATDIDREERRAKIEAGTIRLLDAQGPGWFEREHLPGAIRGRIDDPDGTVAALGGDLHGEIVVYCYSATYTGSVLAATLLEGRGYRNVRRYRQAGLDRRRPLEISAA